MGYIAKQDGVIYGSASEDSLFLVTSAWELRTARNVNISACTIGHLGGGGLAVDEGSDGVVVSDSVFKDTSCWGVRFGQVNDSALDASRHTRNLQLRNSVVHASGAEYRGCSGVMGTVL